MTDMAQKPILQAKSLVKKYGRVVALDHADFDLHPREVLGGLGCNGGGAGCGDGGSAGKLPGGPWDRC